jgi:hypothetical protein
MQNLHRKINSEHRKINDEEGSKYVPKGMQSLCVPVWACGCVSSALASFLHHIITSFRTTSHHISYRINDTRIEHGIDLWRMLRKNENVLRHKVSFEKYSFISPVTKEAWIFLRSMDLFSLQSMKRREGVFSPKAKKRYVCKVSCIAKK